MNRRQGSKKNGFMSIEAVVSMSAVMFVILLGVGFFVYMYPKTMLEKDVHALAQKAKIQGGLTDRTSQPVNSDIEIFLKSLETRGYNRNSIEITAKTNPGNYNVIGVTPLNQGGENYLKRNSKELMVITVKVPANRGALVAPLQFFGVLNEQEDYYYIRETVMSERN